MSPQRDDVPALTHTHAQFLGFLVGFSADNLCFLVYSLACAADPCIIYQLHSPTPSKYTHTHTHTHLCGSTAFLEWEKKNVYYLLLFIIADGAIISRPRHLSLSSLCICVYLFRPLSHSLFPALSSSLLLSV